MVPGPVLVHLPELPLQLSESETLVVGAALPAPPEPGLQIGVDEQLQGAVLRQDQVRVAAHNDAVPVGGQGPEDAALLLKQLPGVMGHGGEIGKGAADGQWDAAKVALLQRILHIALVQCIPPGNGGDDLAVVVGPAQAVGQPLAQLPAAAAELPADGNDFHGSALPFKEAWLCPAERRSRKRNMDRQSRIWTTEEAGVLRPIWKRVAPAMRLMR